MANMERNARNSTHGVAMEKATKRIPLKPTTFDSLFYLKEPGESWDDLVMRLIGNEQDRVFAEDMRHIEQEGVWIPLSDIDKPLGAPKNDDQIVPKGSRVLPESSGQKPAYRQRTSAKT